MINDQEQSQNTLNFLTSWVRKLSLQKNYYRTFIDVDNIDDKSSCKIHDTQNEQVSKIHISGKSVSLNNCKKRLMSALERQKILLKKTINKAKRDEGVQSLSQSEEQILFH